MCIQGSRLIGKRAERNSLREELINDKALVSLDNIYLCTEENIQLREIMTRKLRTRLPSVENLLL